MLRVEECNYYKWKIRHATGYSSTFDVILGISFEILLFGILDRGIHRRVGDLAVFNCTRSLDWTCPLMPSNIAWSEYPHSIKWTHLTWYEMNTGCQSLKHIAWIQKGVHREDECHWHDEQCDAGKRCLCSHQIYGERSNGVHLPHWWSQIRANKNENAIRMGVELDWIRRRVRQTYAIVSESSQRISKEGEEEKTQTCGEQTTFEDSKTKCDYVCAALGKLVCDFLQLFWLYACTCVYCPTYYTAIRGKLKIPFPSAYASKPSENLTIACYRRPFLCVSQSSVLVNRCNGSSISFLIESDFLRSSTLTRSQLFECVI